MNSDAVAVMSRRFRSIPHMPLLLPLMLSYTLQCSMGHQHAAVKTGTGDVWVWGSGARGQLGLGMISARGTSLPSKMPLPPSSAGSVIKVNPSSLFSFCQLQVFHPSYSCSGAMRRCSHSDSDLVWQSFCMRCCQRRSAWPWVSPIRCPIAHSSSTSRFCMRHGGRMGVHNCSHAHA